MSRSYRHTPVLSHTAKGFNRGEQWWKRYAHGALRMRVRAALQTGDWDVLPVLREVSNVWCWPKDGKKKWWGRIEEGRDWRWLMGK